MGAINTAGYLAKIRSRMDAQQQVVALLESELQKSILGGTSTTFAALLDKGTPATSTSSAIQGGKIYEIYARGSMDAPDPYVTGFNAAQDWIDAMSQASTSNTNSDDESIDQEALRHMLYQARALLGELRIEEQAWNGEVNSEKTLRKEVNDFAKI